MSNKHTCSACYRKFATAQAWSAHVSTHAKLKVNVEDLSVEARKAQFEHNLQKTKLENANDLEEARLRAQLLQANEKRVATFTALDDRQSACGHAWVGGPPFTRCSMCSTCGLVCTRVLWAGTAKGRDGEEEETQELEKFHKELSRAEQVRLQAVAPEGFEASSSEDVASDSDEQEPETSDEEGEEGESSNSGSETENEEKPSKRVKTN